ncbi:MAG: polysaccharide deacetylase [Clostridium sp.]|nr:polysaccharide deacetylase [Clostridium sp.]
MKNKLIIYLSIFILLFNITAYPKCINARQIADPPKDSDNSKIIYLSFDDGPSDMTDKILDVLEENNVKATFFLIGNQIEGHEATIRRIHDEGHGMGLHTYTHKYSNKKNFIKEMRHCRNDICKITGVAPNIIRFPGGSRGHLTNTFLKQLHADNFKVYDWNVDTKDGINPKLSPYTIYRRAIINSKDLPTVLLLLHCDSTHKNTCTALPEIIKYYKQQGYEFKIIDDNTEEIYFPIKR